MLDWLNQRRMTPLFSCDISNMYVCMYTDFDMERDGSESRSPVFYFYIPLLS